MPLKDETEPITDDEWLYRRVHKQFFVTSRIPFISSKAFEPRTRGTHPDIDGISLFRAACLDSTSDVLAPIGDIEKRKANGVVKLQVIELKGLGLTVDSTPNADIRGHVSISELSADAYTDDKKRCKSWMMKLSELASPDERIVLEPSPKVPRN